MATRTYGARECDECDKPFTPTGPRQRVCVSCRGKSNEKAHEADHAAVSPEPLSALDVIDAFGLDFNTGNAIRFLLEKSDGDELTNLQNARVYLDRAIARLERQQLHLSL
jgi:hypothetical protein